MNKNILGAAVAALFLAAPAIGQAAAFTNGSFEIASPNAPFGSFNTLFAGDTSMTGWTVTAGTVDLVNTNYFSPDFIASDGQNSVDMTGASEGTIAQTFDTIAGQGYSVTFDLNINSYGGNLVKDLLVSAGATSSLFSYDGTNHPPGQGGPWQSHTLSFTAAGASTTLSFQSLNTGGCCYGVVLDNVNVSGVTAVPEPETYAMMLAGLGLLGFAARRRKQKDVAIA